MIGLEISIAITGLILIINKSYNCYLKSKTNNIKKYETIYKTHSHLPLDKALKKTKEDIIKKDNKLDDITLSYYLLEKKLTK